jgi:hypothetical protein
MYMHIYICIRIHTYIYTYVSIYICIFIYVFLHVLTYICIYIRWENWLQFTQSRLVPKFTEVGFEIIDTPPEVHRKLVNAVESAVENWVNDMSVCMIVIFIFTYICVFI